MTAPKRVQMSRKHPWRADNPDAVIVARPSRWGNPFEVGKYTGLARMPGASDPDAEWEYEGRISADGATHDYFHPDGHVTRCTVRYMTAAECVETYRRLLTGDLTPAMVMSGHRPGLPAPHPGERKRITVEDVRRELAGHDLACWCPLPEPGQPDICHAAVLLEIANVRPVDYAA